MTGNAVLQFFFFAVVTMALALPCAGYLTRVFSKEPSAVERGIGRILGAGFWTQQNWGAYAFSVLFFNALGGAVLFWILTHQRHLPWNPQNLGNLSPAFAFNVAVAFVTNTDWQSYGGEATLSYFSQRIGLTVAFGVGFFVVFGRTGRAAEYVALCAGFAFGGRAAGDSARACS